MSQIGSFRSADRVSGANSYNFWCDSSPDTICSKRDVPKRREAGGLSHDPPPAIPRYVQNGGPSLSGVPVVGGTCGLGASSFPLAPGDAERKKSDSQMRTSSECAVPSFSHFSVLSRPCATAIAPFLCRVSGSAQAPNTLQPINAVSFSGSPFFLLYEEFEARVKKPTKVPVLPLRMMGSRTRRPVRVVLFISLIRSYCVFVYPMLALSLRATPTSADLLPRTTKRPQAHQQFCVSRNSEPSFAFRPEGGHRLSSS
jgi:hypothetical protein